VPGIFSSTNPFSIVLLFLYGIVLRIAAFIDPAVPLPGPSDGVLYRGLMRGMRNMGEGSPLVYAILAYVLLFIQALMLNSVFFRHRLLARPNYLPAMAYLTLTALFPEWWTLSPALVANTLLIWAWSNLTDLYRSDRVKQTLFNTGILIGLSSFVYFPSIGFVFLVMAALTMMRPLNIPEWLIALAGVTIPYYFLFIGLYLGGNTHLSAYLPRAGIGFPPFQQNIWAWGGLLLLMVPFLFSGFEIQNLILRMLIQARKNWSLLLFYLLISLLVPFINGSSGFASWILCAVPFAAFHANFYSRQKSWLPVAVQWVTLGFILALNYNMLVH
jgi:hypothetical protein